MNKLSSHLHTVSRKRFFSSLAVVLLSCLLLSGCGQEQKKLQAYREEMSAFCNSVADCQDQMDAIEPGSASAQEEALALIDQLATLCSDAASLTPPSGYEEAGELCRRAADSLQEAKGSLHAAFEAESFDSDAWQEGLSSYRSAGRCLSLMRDALQESA